VLIGFSARLVRWRIAFLIVAAVAVGALLYQGKTGGELVNEHGVGMAGASGGLQKDSGIPTVSDRGEQREASARAVATDYAPVR